MDSNNSSKTILSGFKRKGQGRQAVISATARKRRGEEGRGRGEAMLVKTARRPARTVSHRAGRRLQGNSKEAQSLGGKHALNRDKRKKKTYIFLSNLEKQAS